MYLHTNEDDLLQPNGFDRYSSSTQRSLASYFVNIMKQLKTNNSFPFIYQYPIITLPLYHITSIYHTYIQPSAVLVVVCNNKTQLYILYATSFYNNPSSLATLSLSLSNPHLARHVIIYSLFYAFSYFVIHERCYCGCYFQQRRDKVKEQTRESVDFQPYQV